MYVRTYVRIVCMYVCMYYVCMYVYVRIRSCLYMYKSINNPGRHH